MKEIGSEFWNIPISNKAKTFILPNSMRWFLSGRGALEHIIADIKAVFGATSVAMPSWCCDSMIVPFLKNGITVRFYTFNNAENIPECDILFSMEHFGYMRQQRTIDFQGIVIHDITHSMFSGNTGMKKIKNAKTEYLFGSLRKWAGFKTGGFVVKLNDNFVLDVPTLANDAYVTLRTQAMLEKEKYILGKTDSKNYMKLFSKAEEMLDFDASGVAAEEDVFKAITLDVELIRKRRKENAEQLLTVVSDIAIYPEIRENDCPFFVPIRLKKEMRNELRKHLIEHNVFCPVHWPLTKYHAITDKQRQIYDEELSLVCDQRYTTDDMDYICELISDFRRTKV